MTLQEIFEQLVYGELAQLSLSENGPDAISEANQLKLTAKINLGLTALYRRFLLKEGRLTLELIPDRLVYPLDRRFAVNDPDSTETDRFIIDSPTELFANDVLKVERVMTLPTDTELDDFELPLNDLADKYSVFTPTFTTLRLPADLVNQVSDLPDRLVGETLEVFYRANHPKLDLATDDPYTVQLELPDTHLEALLLYVAMSLNTPLGMGQFEGVAGNSYMAKYENECQRLEQQGLRGEVTSNTKLHDRGFV